MTSCLHQDRFFTLSTGGFALKCPDRPAIAI
ncbi:hypothetical protein GGD46_003226 [Rhizobium lusitanum]|uniref:Uncharacterized protein n=1 Tax=Rhizobium lusitanum TaxID=293958 RepID=A0A7X0MCK6_9HYPH|nr:hypothetical protein [Rhizobium lusitanum]